MKKALAILFCLQVLSGNSFAMEMLKLPQLVQHYFEHEKNDHPDLGFGAYLWEHYVDGNHADEDKHCDEKLPFKHCHDCCSHHHPVVSFCLIPENISVSSPIVFGRPAVFSAQHDLVSFYNSRIWQPPRLG